MNKFFVIVKSINSKIKSVLNPIGYCRKLGANIGDNCVLKASMLGSEPWLVQIGNHVLLAEGTKLLTHDGAGWCLESWGVEKDG